jgi:proteasome beta subunit
MSTIAAVRCREGVVVAGDRLAVRDGRVERRNRQHVFDFSSTVGAAAVGRDVGQFSDRLAGELRSYQFERDDVSLDALERLASDRTREVGVEAIVATRDEDGRAAFRAISADGSALSDSPMAFGSGATLVLGQLEAADVESVSLSAAETLLREVFASAAERGPGTGGTVDVWTLADVGADG